MRPLYRKVPQLQRLAIFETVARLGSFTAAADELGISQPAVSRHIIKLEDQLGFPLFDRRSNRIAITPRGEALRDSVSSGFMGIERRLDELGQSDSRLVIAAPPTIAQTWLTPFFDDLQVRLDPIHVSVVVVDRSEDLNELMFDIAIQNGRGDWLGYRCQQLFPEVAVPVTSPELADKLGLEAGSDAKQLLSAPLIHYNSKSVTTNWTSWFAGQGIRYVPDPEATHHRQYGTVMNQALTGDGVALAWRYQMGDWIKRGLLTEVGPEVQDPSAGCYLIWPPALNRDHRLRTVQDFLEDVLPPDRMFDHDT